MKTSTRKAIAPHLKPLLIFSLLFVAVVGCRKNNDMPKTFTGYKQTNLVADTAGFNAARIDPTLVNAWGMAIVPSGPIWISSNAKSLSTVYDRTGAQLRPNVNILSGDAAPTGQVFNNTTSFVIPGTGLPAKFIFAGEEGTINAWNSGNDAIKVADGTSWGAVYKGIALGSDSTGNFIYATNFKGRTIDVFDSTFTHVTDKSFQDNSIPNDYGPFNIRNVNGFLYVTYAKQKAPDNEDDEAGAGNGYVDIFSTDGNLVKRFASKGALNSPWGMLQSANGISGVPNAILIGNFGDGRINVYNQNGSFMGPLTDTTNHAIVIDGLWAIENNIPNGDANQIFFTAGPADESHGLFGFLSK